MKELSIEEKARHYDEAIEYCQYLINERCKEDTDGSFHRADLDKMFPELAELDNEQNILFEELKAIHLRMERQTVCNDAGGNRMWRRAWQHINEAINIIKEDKEAFKW